MAEPVVSITLATIRDLLVEEVKSYNAVESQVGEIQKELKRMRSFLKDADSKQDRRVHSWVSEVREAAYDVEDNILVFIASKLSCRDATNPFQKLHRYFKKAVTTYRVGSNISGIQATLLGLNDSLKKYDIKSTSNAGREGSGGGASRRRNYGLVSRCYSHVIIDDFVGMREDIKTLVSHLTDDRVEGVVSIYGMGGLGKTTIANKLYVHMEVRRHFDSVAWASVSQKWDKKYILREILMKLDPDYHTSEEVDRMRDVELMRKVHDIQLKKKCLVVLDDIWSTKAWDALKPAFPNTRNGVGSKILLTSRKQDVGMHVNLRGFHHKLSSLSEDESWELLKKKVIPRMDVGEDDSAPEINYKMDPEMETLGKEMVKRCCGLPLAILVLGGVLVTKYTLSDWKMVQEDIKGYLARGTSHEQKHYVTNVLSFSYHDLPYQFKQCFLYFANFPENLEIEVDKLYHLWLAEGIISEDDRVEEETMMDVAERYLAELAQRCMVQVNVKETAGGFKNCRLHDLMREVCLLKAKDENFSQIIDFRRGIENEPHDMYACSKATRRRLSVYLGPKGTKIPERLNVNDHVRSLFFYADGCNCKEGYMEMVKSCMKRVVMLRVLDIQGFSCGDELIKDIGGLIHLRYLGLSNSQFRKLPSSIGGLKYLQTLDLEVDPDTLLEIPNVLWKMKQLKHLYLPSDFQTKDGSKLRLDGLNLLETLVNFSTSLCDVTDLDGMTNLRKLSAAIKEKLDGLPNIIKYIKVTQNHLKRTSISVSCPQFCSDEELILLKKLLSCHRLYKLSICGRIRKLPEHHDFSSSITKIAFKLSELGEDPMGILEKLPELSSLKLFESTYEAEEMTCLANGFPKLLYLKVWGLSNLKRWRIDEGAMPKLTQLVIAKCGMLEMLPDGLRFITTLKKLNVRRMADGFKHRLRTVEGNEGEDFGKVRHVADIKFSRSFLYHTSS